MPHSNRGTAAFGTGGLALARSHETVTLQQNKTGAMATPMPVVVQSLPPVTFQHIIEGPSPWVAFSASMVVAIFAIIIAVITMVKVNKQTRIAARAPDLRIKFSRGVKFLKSSNVGECCEVRLWIEIINEGSKVAKNVSLEILIRDDLFVDLLLLASRERREWKDTETYRVWTLNSKNVRIPIGNRYYDHLIIGDFRPSISSTQFRWRIFDDDFAYPDKEWGSHELRLSPQVFRAQ